VWNGVNPVPAAVDPSFRTSVGADGRLLVGTVATLIEQKGLRDLLAVAQRCRDAGAAIQFVLVGEGMLRPELERFRHDMGLDDTVTFTGWVQDAASRALPAFDVFFQPSHWEAMSIAILEAMAAGKAIVATRVGDNGHVLEDGVTGLLANPRDIEGMSTALIRLADDPALRERLGEAAARKFAERFTLDHMTRAYENIYREVLGLPAD
jgi:glycosyltransferase involved in cell wall biosynthesis